MKDDSIKKEYNFVYSKIRYDNYYHFMFEFIFENHTRFEHMLCKKTDMTLILCKSCGLKFNNPTIKKQLKLNACLDTNEYNLVNILPTILQNLSNLSFYCSNCFKI